MEKSLPYELLIEILSCLPVKSLMRFRCVSKTWLRLLTIDSQFINLHLNRSIKSSNTNPSILALHGQDVHICYAHDYTACDKAIEFQLPFRNSSLRKYYMFSRSCNGLLCLASKDREKYCNVHVWNPLTGDHITIPCSPIPSDFPDGKNTVFGFGFHHNEYKVIRLVSTSNFQYSASEFQSHVSVYTLGTDSWRTVQDIPYNTNFLNSYSALVNGALHWFGARPGSLVWNILVSFDIKEEVFQEIQQPNGLCYSYPYEVNVGELGGLLCISCGLRNEEVHIWIMKEYGVVDSWTKQFKIGRPEVHVLFDYLEPLGFVNNEEIIVREDNLDLMVYNTRTNSIRSIERFLFKVDRAYTYMGSLVSPSLINGVRHIMNM